MSNVSNNTISEDSVRYALTSLIKLGDSDLFILPFEINVINEMGEEAIDKICSINFSNFSHGSCRNFIVPKEYLSTRRVTQLDPLDSIILTAIVYQYGQLIESRRIPIRDNQVFSYRFKPTPDGYMYDRNLNWNAFWKHCRNILYRHEYALYLDIADFYNQIYHHTLENQLAEATFPNQVLKWIITMCESDTAKVSRGIPVGPHATHLLAEASLIPIDNSLREHGVVFCRYVDDFIIFANSEEEVQSLAYLIGNILDKHQRLIVNRSKIKQMTKLEFQEHCERMLEDRPIDDIEESLTEIIQKHAKGDPYNPVMIFDLSDDELKQFSKENIEHVLKKYLETEPVDFVRLRWFLRRLSQVGHPAGLCFILKNMLSFLPAISDICRYIISIKTNDYDNWRSVGKYAMEYLAIRLFPSLILSRLLCCHCLRMMHGIIITH